VNKGVIGMSYDSKGLNRIDYELCNYDGSRITFRGPKADIEQRYIAFLGATETFGKFVEDPFPKLLAEFLPAKPMNLGMINGGVDAILGDKFVMETAKKADLRIVQVIGALNQTNHYFKVHPRRNDRFVAPREPLKRMFPEIDFAEFHFTKAMLTALHGCSKKRYRMLCDELQKKWLTSMAELLEQLGEKTILLWFGSVRPPKNAVRNPKDPMLIDAKMIAQLRGKASAYVECVPGPQAAERDANTLRGTLMSPEAIQQVMGPIAHAQAAQALQEISEQMMR
jgi:hypothetical protein